MTILLLIAAVVGYFIGVKAPLLIQLVVFVAGLVYINSERVRRMEIGALIPMSLFWVMVLGIAAGDIIFYVVHPRPITDFDFFKWLFTV
jgi:hypothetical protein